MATGVAPKTGADMYQAFFWAKEVEIEVVVDGWTVVVSIIIFWERGPLDWIEVVSVVRAVSSLTWRFSVMFLGRKMSTSWRREENGFVQI